LGSLCLLGLPHGAQSAGKVVNTPYGEPKVVFDFYFDDPQHINSALYWLRAFINPLTEAPYDLAPELMDLIVVIHGTEIVTVVEKNYERYREAVDRMRYYASLGVKFRVCGLAAQDYGYEAEDFHDYIEVVPSAIAELAYWQQQGYGLVMPQVLDKKFSTEEIR
jgi:intracellular sulfur oxidation DsrE/DsrF family protein